jgi:orotate phosphoribosyltransferase
VRGPRPSGELPDQGVRHSLLPVPDRGHRGAAAAGAAGRRVVTAGDQPPQYHRRVTRADDDTSIEEEGPHFVRTGHFQYESGDHGDTWLTLELLFVDPQWLRRAAERLCERLGRFSAEVVCGPIVGGALVAQPVAEMLGARFVYAERRARATGAEYVIPPAARAALAGTRVLIVDDVINAGSATVACAREVRAAGGELVGAASLILRSGAEGPVGDLLGVPIECLHSVRWNIWPADACPLCQKGEPLTHI